ncbi:MAG: DNA-directed RNA polymerase subunit omega [Clostridia bacterium]|nr:DNA-directed RNA polymerase subunit omega [Clostridia bacterium]
MLYPTIEELTKGQHNRYELALATAKCARLITNEYVRQHELAEKAASKEASASIDRELRDEKAVKVAINRMHRGQYSIVSNAAEASTDEE